MLNIEEIVVNASARIKQLVCIVGNPRVLIVMIATLESVRIILFLLIPKRFVILDVLQLIEINRNKIGGT